MWPHFRVSGISLANQANRKKQARIVRFEQSLERPRAKLWNSTVLSAGIGTEGKVRPVNANSGAENANQQRKLSR
jgi:hypothetical protein